MEKIIVISSFKEIINTYTTCVCILFWFVQCCTGTNNLKYQSYSYFYLRIHALIRYRALCYNKDNIILKKLCMLYVRNSVIRMQLYVYNVTKK